MRVSEQTRLNAVMSRFLGYVCQVMTAETDGQGNYIVRVKRGLSEQEHIVPASVIEATVRL